MDRKQMKKKKTYKRRRTSVFRRILLMIVILLGGYGGMDYYMNGNLDRTFQLFTGSSGEETESYPSLDPLPEYDGSPYVIINNNIPEFEPSELYYDSFEYYSDLDALGRCGMVQAMLSRDLMPTEPRGEIGMIKPSGWHTVKYNLIEDRYLYNRCHLIAFELTGENDNERNLITGTRYMNVSGMLPWENRIAQYIRRTNDKVLYRVTPVFKGKELVARGVHMEARSIGSKEIQFNIYVFNVQPGINIDYSDGSSWTAE